MFMARDAPRPILITIIAILEFLAGIAALLFGILLLVGVIASGDLPPEAADLGNVGSVALIIIGLIYLVIAGGFWNGWSIMWYIGVIVNGIGTAFIIYSMVTVDVVSGIIPLVIELVILFYLFRPGVKAFFGI